MNERYCGIIEVGDAYYHVYERHGVYYTVDVFNAGHRRSSQPFRSLDDLYIYLSSLDGIMERHDEIMKESE